MRNSIITGCVALGLATSPAWAQIAVSSNDHKVKQENGVTPPPGSFEDQNAGAL